MGRVHLSPDETGQWGNTINYPYQSAVAVTLGTPFNLCRGLYVGTTGTVIATMADGNAVTFTAVPAGSILPIAATNVSASSTAGSILALY